MEYFNGFVCEPEVRPRKNVIPVIRPANCSAKISENLVRFLNAILLELFSDLKLLRPFDDFVIVVA